MFLIVVLILYFSQEQHIMEYLYGVVISRAIQRNVIKCFRVLLSDAKIKLFFYKVPFFHHFFSKKYISCQPY